MTSDQRAGKNRVRLVPSALLQGSAVEGEMYDEGPVGIAIDVDTTSWFQPTSTGVERRFYPWTSVAYIVRDPEEAVHEPF